MRPIDADKLIEQGYVLEKHGKTGEVLGIKSLADVPTVEDSKVFSMVWMRIFTDYIKSYEAINTIYKNGYVDEDELALMRHKLLTDIIETFRSEVEE